MSLCKILKPSKEERVRRLIDYQIDCYEDIFYIMTKVDTWSKYRQFKFNRTKKKEMKKVEDDYMLVHPEYLLEIYNCAYEKIK